MPTALPGAREQHERHQVRLHSCFGAKCCMPEQRLDVRLGSMLAGAVTAAMRSLHPASKAHKRGTLPVSPLHTLAFEVHGNPQGQPVLCVHGGPGAGAYANHACVLALKRQQFPVADLLRAPISISYPATPHQGDRAAGPGRRFFDLRHWRVVLVDQRACGASTPRGCLTDNTTQV